MQVTNGKRTASSQRPINLATYLTGEGLLSINKFLCNGWSMLSNLSASSNSFLFSDLENFWKSEHIFGAIFAVTLIVPTPPLLLNSNALSSFPVNWINSSPIFDFCWSTLSKSPVASFTPTIFFNSKSLAIVSTDISITDLDGML